MADQVQNSSERDGAAEGNSQQSFRIEENAFSNIEHIIAVVSGKGGVGKSLVTASLANSMAVQGHTVGIMDADITGPSIPRMYGLKGTAESDGNGIYPPAADNGVEIMSTNLLLPNEDDPVIWRGPVIAGVVKQFYTDVIWGQLDYLFVDMPPGTGDVPLTVFQSIPVEGIIIVTSPQDLVKMIVRKAWKMAEMMKIPVIGVIENYSYMVCPHCGEKISVFGESGVDAAAAGIGVPVLGKIPICQEYSEAADKGVFAGVNNTYVDDATVSIVKWEKENLE